MLVLVSENVVRFRDESSIARADLSLAPGLHKVERPKFERRTGPGSGISALTRYPTDVLGMMTPDEAFGEPPNFGTDISTLARRIEADRF